MLTVSCGCLSAPNYSYNSGHSPRYYTVQHSPATYVSYPASSSYSSQPAVFRSKISYPGTSIPSTKANTAANIGLSNSNIGLSSPITSSNIGLSSPITSSNIGLSAASKNIPSSVGRSEGLEAANLGLKDGGLKSSDIGVERLLEAANLALNTPFTARSLGINKPISLSSLGFTSPLESNDLDVGADSATKVFASLFMDQRSGLSKAVGFLNFLDESVDKKTFGEENTVCLSSIQRFFDSFMSGFSQTKAKEAAGTAFLEGVAALPDFDSTPSLCGKAAKSFLEGLDGF